MIALVAELVDALSYLVDTHHGEVARAGEDPAPYQQAAYWKAIAAIRKANGALREAKPATWMDKSKKANFAIEQKQPLKQELRTELATIGNRITKGVAVLADLESLGEDDRIKRRGTFAALAARYGVLAWQCSTPLPSTDLCVCRHCNRINLPVAPGSYVCACNAAWGYHRATNTRALPDGFWLKYRPGDKYTRLEPVLDGRGRPELLGDIAV